MQRRGGHKESNYLCRSFLLNNNHKHVDKNKSLVIHSNDDYLCYVFARKDIMYTISEKYFVSDLLVCHIPVLHYAQAGMIQV